MARVFVTGHAGFIGFHLCSLLLDQGHEVFGFDGFSDYYDGKVNEGSFSVRASRTGFQSARGLLEDFESLHGAVQSFKPDIFIHLAAQAGVRHSIDEPRGYITSNITGFFNVLECCRMHAVRHLLAASTSSVYGGNSVLPYTETDKADLPLSLYSATKKSNEVMAHSYAHLWKIPTTMFRFFTVYGPWGRPDMALFKFTDAILSGRTIDVYNHGNMFRDFTYVSDLVNAIVFLAGTPPSSGNATKLSPADTLSPVAPHRIVNIGNGGKVKLIDFIHAIETEIGMTAKINFLGMQTGEVPATWADNTLLHHLTGYKPKVSLDEGISQFVTWFRNYYRR